MGEWSESKFGEEGKMESSASKVEEKKSTTRRDLGRLDNRAKPFFGVIEAAVGSESSR